MSSATRHEPTVDCNGKPPNDWLPGHERFGWCDECEVWLCLCEINYGHDCETTDRLTPEPRSETA